MSDNPAIADRPMEVELAFHCITCSDNCTPGVDAIQLNNDMAQCAWCHFSEFGTWPHGMTMNDE